LLLLLLFHGVNTALSLRLLSFFLFLLGVVVLAAFLLLLLPALFAARRGGSRRRSSSGSSNRRPRLGPVPHREPQHALKELRERLLPRLGNPTSTATTALRCTLALTLDASLC
ncbi:unnamed protein product, partial [Ectocarpus sp. 8 AP-2014]